MVVLVAREALTSAHSLTLSDDCARLLADMREQLCDTACSADPFESAAIDELHPARTEREAYLRARFPLPEHDALRERWAVVAFEVLPALLRSLLDHEGPLFLFLENYIVKPGHSELSFRWHRDADEQLACVPEQLRPRYWACWCPLDHAHAANGTLVVEGGEEGGEEATGGGRGIALDVQCGSAVVFSSDEWHCSGPNASPADRRVFYAQYSLQPVLVGAAPLSFAVPC